MKKFIYIFLLLTFAIACNSRAENPLPSWNDGATKQSIITFVEQVTDPKSFASQKGIPVTINNSNFTNGLIIVRSTGGSSSCALVQGSMAGKRVTDIALILLIPIAFVALRRIWKKG